MPIHYGSNKLNYFTVSSPLAYDFFKSFTLIFQVLHLESCAIHSCKFHFFLVGFSTQLPQAAGVAYSLKMDKKEACVVVYFGDGSTSEVIKSHTF